MAITFVTSEVYEKQKFQLNALEGDLKQFKDVFRKGKNNKTKQYLHRNMMSL